MEKHSINLYVHRWAHILPVPTEFLKLEGGLRVIDFENGMFQAQVETLVDRRRWAELRDLLEPLEPADIAALDRKSTRLNSSH